MIGYIVCLTGSYLVISRYNFYLFRHIITNIVFLITFVGIIVFLLSELEILPYQTIMTSNGTVYTTFLFYTLGWPYLFHRYSGIWHEPGACQIVLNTLLWLHLDKITAWKWEKGEKLKLMVIFLGSILTFSTGGYLVLLLFFFAVFSSSFNRIKKRPELLVMLFLLSIGLAYLLYNSPVIQDKLFNDDVANVSKIGRQSDAEALWRMTLDKPLVGYGIGTEAFWATSLRYGNTSCSTGLLTYSASLGVFWLILFVTFVWKQIRRMHLLRHPILLLLAVMMMQSNEKFIEYPITSIFVFQFASYYNNGIAKQ